MNNYNLDEEIDVSLTSRAKAGYTDGQGYDESQLIQVDGSTEIDEAFEAAKVEVDIPDEVDYTTDKPYLLIDRLDLFKALKQIGPIINLGSKRAVSRGITLRFDSKKENSVRLINVNETYYYSVDIPCETTLPEDTTIFIEYAALQKISKFLHRKIRITMEVAEDGRQKFFLFTKNGDLELINTRLLDAELKLTEMTYNITDEVIASMEKDSLNIALSTLSRITTFESDSKRRTLSTKNNLTTFTSPLVRACSQTQLFEKTIRRAEVDYMLMATTLANNDTKVIQVYKVESDVTRYAIYYDDSFMITNYADSKEDIMIPKLIAEIPDLTQINFANLKYQLDYANSITYAIGMITFEVKNGVLLGTINLQNQAESVLDIELESALTIPEGTKFKVNTKTLLSTVNSLDANLPTYIGYKDGMLYIKNDYVTMLLTIF